MSAENVEAVRAAWEPFKGLDVTAVDWDAEPIRDVVAGLYSPDVELRWSTTGPDTRVYRGVDGVIEAFRGWIEPFSEYRVEVRDYIDAGDRVVVPTRQWGIGKASGIPVEIEVTHVHEFRDGLIVRFDEYDTLEEAMEAIGRGQDP